MFKLAVFNTKGGVGKTTLSTNLAVAFHEQRGKVCLLVDIDPQCSSIDWYDLREKQVPTVVTAPINRLEKVIEAAELDGVTHLIIDCPPRGDSSAVVAVRQVDFILIPCLPSGADLKAIKNTVSVVDFAGVPAVVVLNSVRSRGTLVDEARESLKSTKLKVLDETIGNHVAFIRAYSCGLGVTEYEPNGLASKEIPPIQI